MKIPEEILERLAYASSVVIIPHVRPDGDALGSSLALCRGFHDNNIPAKIVVDDEVSDMYSWLDTDGDIIRYRDPEDLQADLIVYLDGTDPNRFGKCGKHGVHDMCIDHHISNEEFAEMNFVQADASSTSEMIYNVLLALEWKITPEIAEAIYVGIATDTGGFNFTNTTPQTHRVAAALMECGVVPRTINSQLYDERPLEELHLRSSAYKNIEQTHGGKSASLTIEQTDLKSVNADSSMTHDYVDIPRSVRGVRIALFFLEQENGMIKVSLRSEPPYDVNAIAQSFNGGGHSRASGCRIDGEMNAVKQQVWDRVQQELDAREGSV